MSRLLNDPNDPNAGIRYLDPTHEQDTEPASLAPRLGTLEGSTIGLISNGKHGVEPLFDEIERLLLEEHGVGAVIRRTKTNYSAPAELAIVDQIHSWDAVLAGVGD